jgi:hypothetical protein
MAKGRRLQLSITAQKRIENLYKDALKRINGEINYLERVGQEEGMPDYRKMLYLRELTDQIKSVMTDIDSQTETIIKDSMLMTSKAVISSNGMLLSQMGFNTQLTGTAFMYVPQDIVEELASGKLYEGRPWTLSRAIWSDNALKNNDLDYIVGRGIAQQKSVYDIAKDLETYVNPSTRKDWDWSKVYPLSKKKIDYNAQRLARTMISHAYQESFVRTTKDNPFITAYKWEISNASDRVCEVCKDRATDNKFGLGAGIFPKDQLPLDHPNGMCTYTSVIPDSMYSIADKLADWTLGKGDANLNKQIDRFVSTF